MIRQFLNSAVIVIIMVRYGDLFKGILNGIIESIDPNDIPLQTFAIPNISSLFSIHSGEYFQNNYIIKDIIQNREREIKISQLLTSDRFGLNLIVEAAEKDPRLSPVDPIRDGILTQDPSGRAYFLIFPFYDYDDKSIHIPFQEIYGKIVYYSDNKGWILLNEYQTHLKRLLIEYVPLFPECADLVVNDFDLDDDCLVVKFLCGQTACSFKVDWTQNLNVLHEIGIGILNGQSGPVPSNLCFGDNICCHFDGNPRGDAEDSNDAVNIEQVGMTCSAIKTHCNYVMNHTDKRGLLNNVSHHGRSYGNIKNNIKKHKNKYKLNGDVIQNITRLDSLSTTKMLKLAQIPLNADSKEFFGFIHDVKLFSGVDISLYDPIISPMMFRYHHNAYLDTTGGLTADFQGLDGVMYSGYHFCMTVDSPFGKIQGANIFENISSSKSSRHMHQSLVSWGNKYNQFYGKPVGKLYLPERKYVHLDTDIATSNAVCAWGNGGIYFRDYVIKIWEYLALMRPCLDYSLILVWCWCHIIAYIAAYNKPYQDKPKPIQRRIKQCVLYYFNLMKLALSFTVLLSVINEIYCILTIEKFKIGEAVKQKEITVHDIIEKLHNDKCESNNDAVFSPLNSKREIAKQAESANKLLEDVELCDVKIEEHDNDDAYYVIGSTHVWAPIDNKKSVKFYYNDNAKFVMGSIGKFPVPIKRVETEDGIFLINLLFCVALWYYIFGTIIFAPTFNEMTVGGSTKNANTIAELTNRLLKFTYGFKRMLLDNYLYHRWSVWHGLVAQFLIRFKQQLSKQYISMPGFQDMWRGKNFVPAATNEFDLICIKQFSMFIDNINGLKKTMGKDILWQKIHALIESDGFKHRHNLNQLSKQMINRMKNGKELVKHQHYRKIVIYYFLWMRNYLERVMHVTLEPLDIETIPELQDKNINDNDDNYDNDDQ